MAHAVEFHSGIPDKLGYACRLLRKAQVQGARVVVTGEASALRALDERLWTFEPLSFVAHAVLAPGRPVPERLLKPTPIWLVEPGAELPHREVVVNLGPSALPDAAACGRLIDLVANDAAERAAGRQRWRAYEAQGCTIRHHTPLASA